MEREELIKKAKSFNDRRYSNLVAELMADFALSAEREAFKAGFLSAIGHPAKQEWIDKAYKEWKEAGK